MLGISLSLKFCVQQYACSYSTSGRGAKARGVVTIESGNEYSLLSAVGTAGPVATYVDGSHSAFQVYILNLIALYHPYQM